MKCLKPLFLLIAVLTAAVPFLAKDKIVESKWTPTPVQIDGKNADWDQDVLEKNTSEWVRYGFKNDATHLYCLFIFDESKTVSSINETGLTFWLNFEGKEKKVYGLKFFPHQVNGEQLIKELEKEGQTVPEEKKKEFIASKTPFMLYGCEAVDKKENVLPHPGKGIATFRTAFVPSKSGGKDRQGRPLRDMVYEFVIPVSLFVDPTTQTPFDAAKPFKLGFEWGGATSDFIKAQAARIGDQGATARVGGANQSSENAGFGAPSAELSSMRRSLPKKYDFWVDLKFAQNQQ